MTRRFQRRKASVLPPIARPARKPSGLKRFVVGMALSGAFASAATMIAYQWRKHEEEAYALEHRIPARLLDKLMPFFEFQDSIWVHVEATPRQIFRALDEVTTADMPLAWAMGVLRYLPAMLTGKLKFNLPGDEPFAKQLLSSGNTVLGKDPEREIVIGMLGKFHQLTDQALVPFKDAVEFADFNDPAYQKLAMSIRVEPDEPASGYTLLLEHRTHALSDESERQFGRYWLAIKPGGALVSKLLLNAVKQRAERYALEDSIQILPTNPSTLSTAV
jgi:hypothetical protein